MVSGISISSIQKIRVSSSLGLWLSISVTLAVVSNMSVSVWISTISSNLDGVRHIHILHTKGKGQQQPWPQLQAQHQPRAFRNIQDGRKCMGIHHIQHILDGVRHIHILHTEGKGQQQPWPRLQAQQKQQLPGRQ